MIRPRNRTYTVCPNDSLWKIASREYGDPHLWPEIAQKNSLKVPGMLFRGQVLQLPEIPGAHPPSYPGMRPPPPPSGPAPKRSRALPPNALSVAYPSFKFEVKKKVGPLQQMGYRATLTLKGELLVQKKGALENFTISNLKDIELKYKTEYQNSIARLTDSFEFVFKPDKRKIEFSGKFTQTMRYKGKDWTSYSITPGVNSIKFAMEPSPIEGTVDGLDIKGNLGYEILIEFDDSLRRKQPSPVYSPVPFRFPISLRPSDIILILVAAIAAVLLVEALPVIAVAMIAFITIKQFIRETPGPAPTYVPTI